MSRNDSGVEGQDFKRGNVCTSCRVQDSAHYRLVTSSNIDSTEKKRD